MLRSCTRGRTSQRPGLLGLASLRIKTSASTGCFSASRQSPHWRASKVSGLETSQAQETISARSRKADATAANRNLRTGPHYTEGLFPDHRVRWPLWATAGAALFFLYFFGLTRMGLITPDEPRYAAIGQTMAQSG